MILMNNDIITLYDENNLKHEYKLLFVIDKEFKYIVYTNVDNYNIKKDLYVIKVKSLNNNEKSIPITDDEWKMINDEYQKLINN